jgi:hypothetical protein
MKHLVLLFWIICLACELGTTSQAYGHGFAGARFFPATLSTDDPFVADEFSMPTISSIVTPDDGGTRDTEISSDIALRITPKWDIEFGETFITLNPSQGKAVNGFDNLSIGSKYEFFENDEHEAVVSLGLAVDVGGTGSKEVGADTFSMWTPALFFGKGFGDLPQGLSLVRPLAITGLVGVAIPSSASTDGSPNPAVLQLGFAFEYSLIYLQEQVKDIGLRAPFDRLIPLVEISLSDPLDRGQNGLITGTVDPGIIWSGKYFQVGAEAVKFPSIRARATTSASLRSCTSIWTIFFHTALGVHSSEETNEMRDRQFVSDCFDWCGASSSARFSQGRGAGGG